MRHVRWKIQAMEDDLIHGSNPLNVEFTLCGNAFEGGDQQDVEQDLVETRRRISCPRCIQMIDECKSVKASEVKRAANVTPIRKRA